MLLGDRSSSCMAMAASEAAVTLGNTSQSPSPSGLTMRPPCCPPMRETIWRWSARRAVRSGSRSARKRAVEPLMSVFMMAVACSVVMATRRHGL
jgi:hypothetical protein